MSEFKIEKDVPIPRRGRGPGGASAKYPFATMEVGDSFLMTGATPAQASSAASYWRHRHGLRFATRKVAGGIRVWRVG